MLSRDCVGSGPVRKVHSSASSSRTADLTYGVEIVGMKVVPGPGKGSFATFTISQSRRVTETISSQHASSAGSSQRESSVRSPQQSISHTCSIIPLQACTSTGVAVTETKKETESTDSRMVWINFSAFYRIWTIIRNLTHFLESYWVVDLRNADCSRRQVL